MPAGVAYDGSVWVTAASSVALVAGTLGFVVVGGSIMGKKIARGELNVTTGPVLGDTEGTRRSQPLQKSEQDERMPSQGMPSAESLDVIEDA